MTIVAAALGAAGCKRAPDASLGADPVPPAAVQSEAVAEIEVPVTLRLSGSLKGERETDLAANAAGRVTATSAERGAQVVPGQVIAQLDVRAASLAASEAKAQAESVRAQQAQALTDCARYGKLRETGAISDAEYERVAVQCRTLPLSAEAASARASIAAQNVGDGAIRAPFAGVVTERYVDVGEYVRQDSRVVTLVSVDPLRLELSVPEADAARVSEGAEVSFRVAAHPGRRFTGRVRFVSGAIRASTRDLPVEALVENADRALKPGMFADVELVVGARKVPGVPRAAVFDAGGTPHAFFVVDGRLEERALATVEAPGGLLGVTKGARPGERVAVGDVGSLRNGARVR
ncbi:MAG TPA: efflux RND transporter periplasmic adaptor subunit [Polyangiaceae bacterium]|nr:efflux RND transporter periplasmic adaptor subunit [Polyangiaceae bacterium]